MGLIAALSVIIIACAWLTNNRPRVGIIATAVVCLACSAYLFMQKAAASGAPSLCNINEVLNCDVVNASEASMAFGLPITLFGIAFYAGLTLAGAMTNDNDKKFFSLNMLFAVFSCVYSLYLAWVSKQIGAFCVVCITMYAGNFILLFGSWVALKRLKTTIGENLGNALTSTSNMLIAGTFAIVCLVGQSYWASQEGKKPTAVKIDKTAPEKTNTNELSRLYSRPLGQVSMDGTEHILGNPTAPYLILEFADFGCPHCAIAGKELKEIVSANPDIQVRFRTFPLSGACNPVIEDKEKGVERCKAAIAAECAGAQGKFFDLSTLLFANQQYLTDENIQSMANQAGVNMDSWATCVNDPATLRGIEQDAMAGVKAGVQGTPTLFVRGTHGDQFVVADHGPMSALRVIEAHRAGVSLPPATAHEPH